MCEINEVEKLYCELTNIINDNFNDEQKALVEKAFRFAEKHMMGSSVNPVNRI